MRNENNRQAETKLKAVGDVANRKEAIHNYMIRASTISNY